MKKEGKIARRTLATFLLVVSVLTTSISLSVGLQLKNSLNDTYTEFGFSYVKAAAEYIDGDSVSRYYQTKKKDAYYDTINKYLNASANSTIHKEDKKPKGANIKYLYVFVPSEDEYTYIWDAEPGLEPEDFLAKYPYSEGAEEQAHKILNKEITQDSQFYTDAEDGTPTLTVSVPLYDSKENVVAIIAADLSVEGLRNSLNSVINSLIASVVIIMVLTMIAYYFATKRLIITPIVKLHTATEEIVENLGNEEIIKIDINTNDEIELLANSFENMEIKLREYIKQNEAITAEKERIGTELELATRIQADMLPNIFPPFPERTDFDVFASMTPAKEVGGDFYDFFLIDDTHLAMVMADVSGKGVPAALFMMMSKILIKNAVNNGNNPAEALTTVNEQICANNREEMFVTVWLGIIDLETGLITATNAGHEKPIIKHKGGNFECLMDKHGFIIGGMSGIKYKSYEIQLQRGSKLFIYTDGLVEATNKDDELFGIERTLEALNKVKNEKPRDILQSVKLDVDEFVATAPKFDDLTMLCFEYFGSDNEITFSTTFENVNTAIQFVSKKADMLPFSSKEKYQIEISVDEIVSNIVRYAYEDNEGEATVKVTSDNDTLTIQIIDYGIPYNPLEKEDPDVTLSADERGIGGYGIFIVKKVMDEIHYEYKDGKNILTLIKRVK